MLQQTGWVARGVLGMLLFVSVFSWALIFQKSRMFSRMNQQTALFLRIFRSNKILPDPRQMGAGGSPLESLYSAGFRAVDNQVRGATPRSQLTSLTAATVSVQFAAADELPTAPTCL